MSMHIAKEGIAEKAAVSETPASVPEADRTFNMPTGVFVATAGLYLAFIAILGVGFANPGLALPLAVFTLVIVAFFGLAAIFVGVDPKGSSKILTWGEFRHRGLDTHTGRLPMRDAVFQTLILPVLIVIWGLTVITIASLI